MHGSLVAMHVHDIRCGAPKHTDQLANCPYFQASARTCHSRQYSNVARANSELAIVENDQLARDSASFEVL